MLELLFQIIGELLLQIVAEVLGREAIRRAPNSLFAAIHYGALGAALAGLSLLIFPTYLVPEALRIANLVLTPLFLGALMAWIGSRRVRRGQTVLRIDRFSYGYVFALCFALVRFWCAK